jgi:hypothetical protein
MLGRVALVRTDVWQERIASIIRVTRIGELGITLAVTRNRRTQRYISEDGISEQYSLPSHPIAAFPHFYLLALLASVPDPQHIETLDQW